MSTHAHRELAARLGERDPLTTPAAQRAMDPDADASETTEEEFLAVLRSLSDLSQAVDTALREMITHRPAQFGPSMRAMASATHLSHSTVFRIVHDGPRTPQQSQQPSHAPGEA